MAMRVFTIGFTKKSAEDFFSTVCGSGARRIVDVRLNNVSQLAGFSKRDDLRFFLQAVCGLDYIHLRELAPTQELLDEYRKAKSGWPTYEQKFLGLMRQRNVEDSVPREVIADSCILCSEASPQHCHRRLVAEYLREQWGDLEIVHLT